VQFDLEEEHEIREPVLMPVQEEFGVPASEEAEIEQPTERRLAQIGRRISASTTLSSGVNSTAAKRSG
jgi:hypothetical protein